MLVDFEFSGGFANLRFNYHTNTDTLPKDQADEILGLVESSGFFDLRQAGIAPAAMGRSPDSVQYRLSLSDGIRQNNLIFDDETAPASLHPLLGLLQKLAVEQKLKGR